MVFWIGVPIKLHTLNFHIHIHYPLLKKPSTMKEYIKNIIADLHNIAVILPRTDMQTRIPAICFFNNSNRMRALIKKIDHYI